MKRKYLDKFKLLKGVVEESVTGVHRYILNLNINLYQSSFEISTFENFTINLS